MFVCVSNYKELFSVPYTSIQIERRRITMLQTSQCAHQK